MNYIIKADIIIFSVIMLAYLLVYFIINAPQNSPAKKLFIAVIVSLMLCASLAALSYVSDGIEKPWAVSMSKIVTSLLMIFSYIPVAAWLAYLDYKVFNNFDSTKKHLLVYLAPFFLSIVFMAINPFTDIMFSIEKGNHVMNRAGSIITDALMYLELLVLLFISQRFRKRINTRIIRTAYLFMLLPMAANFIEYFYAVRVVWPAFAFSTFMVFLALEKDAMLKDSLTKLNTRVSLESRIKQKLRRKEPFSLIMIDLDGFKKINDNYGHRVGDDALMVVASILEDSVKRTDMVCRFGGDEFLILVESPRANAARYIRDRIKSRVSAFNKKKVKPYEINMSFGLKFYNKRNINIKQLMAEVDRLMYTDKEKNKLILEAQNNIED